MDTKPITDVLISKVAPNIVQNRGILADFDNLALLSGTYYVSGSTENIPSGAYGYGIASVERAVSGDVVYFFQKFYPHKRPEIYQRMCWNGVFTSWQKFTGEVLT